MAILEKEVWVGVSNSNRKYLEEIGYDIPKYTDKRGRIKVKRGTKILVKIDDLQYQSRIKVTKICDDCGKSSLQYYYAISTSRSEGDGKDRCFNCGKIKASNVLRKVEYERTLEYCANRDEKEYLLAEFSDKNIQSPNEIAYKSNDKFIWVCPKCNSEYLTKMQNREKGSNCPYCANKKVNQTNCLWTTHPTIANLLKDKNIGYEITAGSERKEIFICDKCGNEKRKLFVYTVVQNGFSCSKCSDGITYPEKFLMSFLDQLNVDYETQKVFDWAKDKKYDFYIGLLNCIVETHGAQHYTNIGFYTARGKNLKEEQLNDTYKMNRAKENNINKYIVLDCRESKLEIIKKSIINSELAIIYNLSNIDWLKCHEFACNTLVKVVCDLWREGIKSTVDIGKIVKLDRATVSKYLKQGVKLSWSDYDPIKVQLINGFNASQKRKKKVVQLTKSDGKLIKVWDSAVDIQQELGINKGAISNACKGKSLSSGGFKWLFKEDYDKLIGKI